MNINHGCILLFIQWSGRGAGEIIYLACIRVHCTINTSPAPLSWVSPPWFSAVKPKGRGNCPGPRKTGCMSFYLMLFLEVFSSGEVTSDLDMLD